MDYIEELLDVVYVSPADALFNNKNIVEDRKVDSNYEKINVPLNQWKNGKFYETKPIEVYGSGQTGYRIRNAVTGQIYPYLVGSAEEDLFFKVCDSTGRYKRKHPLILFYDSPEHYENHQYENRQDVISQNVKNIWQEKNFVARQRLMGCN
jgi:hypothetical protein